MIYFEMWLILIEGVGENAFRAYQPHASFETLSILRHPKSLLIPSTSSPVNLKTEFNNVINNLYRII